MPLIVTVAKDVLCSAARGMCTTVGLLLRLRLVMSLQFLVVANAVLLLRIIIVVLLGRCWCAVDCKTRGPSLSTRTEAGSSTQTGETRRI